MLEQVIYKNHLNEVFDFGKNGIFVNESDLRDYTWETTLKNKKISSIDRSTDTRSLPVKICCDSEEEGTAAKNRLFEITEKDVLALEPGRIIIGGYYYRCYVTGSKKTDYLTSKRYLVLDLTLTSDFPFWIKETTTIFRKSSVGTADGKNFDYAFDYPFDYYSDINSKELVNNYFVPANFRMIVYGPCENPTWYISNHRYRVNCTVQENEYLTIDSINKKIYVTANDGTTTNVFNSRDRESYIFQKIPTGINTVSWDGTFGLDITLLEERSEPKWT